MNICFVCISLRSGGTERIVKEAANYVSRMHDVSVILLSNETPFHVLDSRVNLIQPPVGRRKVEGLKWYFSIVRYLWDSISRVKPEIVLCFGEHIAPLVLLISRLNRIRALVFNRASPLSSLRGIRGFVNPIFYPLSQSVIVQTERSVGLMRQRYPYTNFRTWPNPVSIPREIRSIVERPNVILNVGTLGGRKNQKAIISAFSQANDWRRWRLVLVGEGPDRDALARLCVDLGVADNVFFEGQRSDVSRFLGAARIFAFSSLTEGFPNALAEALAAGCACVSFDCPTGPAELITHNVNGLLVQNGNDMEFAQELDKLMGDESLQIRLSAAAREDIKRFSSERVLAELERLIFARKDNGEPKVFY